MWLISFVIILFIGTIEYGHIPAYGKDPKPDNLLLGFFGVFNFIWVLYWFFNFAFLVINAYLSPYQ